MVEYVIKDGKLGTNFKDNQKTLRKKGKKTQRENNRFEEKKTKPNLVQYYSHFYDFLQKLF